MPGQEERGLSYDREFRLARSARFRERRDTNAITVPEGGGEELARRFAERVGAVDQAEGFQGFELLRPTDDRDTWLVVTRWRDAEAFDAWVASPAFAHGHRGVSGQGESRPPVAVHSELWSYEVALGAKPSEA